MEKSKVLVLGADGMAGGMITSYLSERGFDMYTTTRGVDEGNRRHFDIVERYGDLEGILDSVKPDFVINCIGVLNQFAEDHKPEAVLINSFFPHFADSLSEKYGFKFVHISTDCVFSGERGAYSESDFADAASFYGKSKRLGEVENSRSLTFRTSIVGPDRNENGIGLFGWFMKQEGEVKGFRNVYWSGVTTLELAKAIEKSFTMPTVGLFHLVNNGKISKYELLGLFKKYSGKRIEILPDSSYTSDKSLVCTRTDCDFQVPTYDRMVSEMCEWIHSHREAYPNITIL